MTSTQTPENSAPEETGDHETGEATSSFGQTLEQFESDAPPAAQQAPEVQVGARVRGTLVSIGDTHAIVDFGGRSEGVIETRHLKDASGTLAHAVGDALDLFVLASGDQVTLGPSVQKVDQRAALQQLHEARRSEIPVSAKVTGRNAGGLEVDVAGVRGFCPSSQVELGFCADPTVYVGQTLDFIVTEVKDGRGGVVLSRRALLKRTEGEQGRRLLETIAPGNELEGTVARLEPFGAFIDLGGVDGLVHVSEIRHERTGHPSQVLSVGEKVHVRVLRIDRDKGPKPRIGLSIKAAAPDPWTGIEQQFHKGMRVTGTVARLTDFGAFVNLAPGVDGLVHVSEAAPQAVNHVREAFTVGQSIEAQVLAVDPDKRRISLSVRALTSESAAPAPSSRPRSRREPVTAPKIEIRSSTAPPEETTMAIALRKAMEKAKARGAV